MLISAAIAAAMIYVLFPKYSTEGGLGNSQPDFCAGVNIWSGNEMCRLFPFGGNVSDSVKPRGVDLFGFGLYASKIPSDYSVPCTTDGATEHYCVGIAMPKPR